MKPQVVIRSEDRPSWKLSRAVLVYTAMARDSLYGIPREDRSRAYATVHDIVEGRGLQLGQGVPATREACAELARALGANANLSGFIPENLLYLGARVLAWWRPPGPGRVFFDTTRTAAGDQLGDPKAAARIGKRSGAVPHPGLVFLVAGRQWFVYAVPGKERPGPATQLWRAPYFNVWASGEICTGNVRLPETLSPAALAAYEKAFFDSEFTHPNIRGKEKLVDHADGPYGFWRALLDRPLELGFPEEALVATKATLQRVAERLEKGERLAD